MIYTDEVIRQRLDLGLLDPSVAEEMLATFYNTLDKRMGLAIAEKLNDEQLTRFENLRDSGEDDQAIEDWLIAAIPNYQNMLEEEAGKLLDEIDKDADQMLSYLE